MSRYFPISAERTVRPCYPKTAHVEVRPPNEIKIYRFLRTSNLMRLVQKKLFTELGLSPELLKAIDKIGFEQASPIQSIAIPALLSGSDVVGQSQTGSGKTAAFAIPAIEKVDPALRVPQILILCPTRELAVQVAEEIARLATFKRGVQELPIYGGQSYERQFRGLQQGSQIIVGTPGRVMDHLERKSLRLDQLKMVILDEADRMLDMGFLDDIRLILEKTPKKRQTVFFSATLPRPIQTLIKTFTSNPVFLTIEDKALTIPDIDQVYYEVDRRFKIDALCRIIDLQNIKLGLIFCATKMMVDDLTEHLIARGYAADKMHGDMTQGLRERVIGKFKKKNIEFLVATDVAARGIDVDDIEVVFNYDLPHDGEDYVHRIGRTGRAGRSGRAVTFVSGREIYKLQSIIRFTKGRIRRERVPSSNEVEEKRSSLFFESLRETLEKGDYKRHDALIEQLLDQGYETTSIVSALIHLLSAEKARPAAPVATERAERSEQRSFGRDRGESRERRQSAKPPRFAEDTKPKFFQKEPAATKIPPRPPGMNRIVLGAGKSHEVQAGDILGVILGATRIPKEAVGEIRMFAKQTIVDIRNEEAPIAAKKLNGIQFKGRKLWSKIEGPAQKNP